MASVFYGSDKQLTDKVLAEVKRESKSIDGELVRTQLSKASTNLQQLISRIDNLSNLSIAEKNTLKADINSSVELTNLFTRHTVKIDEFANAWKNVGKYHAELKKDATSLEAFISLKK
ncbi:hypothetical protein [Myroides sp. WP-1]|uniref:hypothetical protein n=1 Tax=Myroides sp. WP-1 TaxID=2759944 RepID=UPI0015FA4C01|nr:hypothetical protein [Myroides sp. WP-1]MBB1140670.1 hypothetical protein [Myroides sp. WP-1]